MGALIAASVFTVLMVGGVYWLSNLFLRRIGVKTTREISPASRRALCLSMGVGLAVAAVEFWAFSTHHAAVGVVVLIVVFVLPEFVVIPLRIRRSRAAAEVSRARRGVSRGGPGPGAVTRSRDGSAP